VEHKVRRSLAGSPTKSPSSGLHKPTWKPSSKPNEHRDLQSSGSKLQPPEGIEAKHPAVPVDATAGVPTKSPSAGLHKPTW